MRVPRCENARFEVFFFFFFSAFLSTDGTKKSFNVNLEWNKFHETIRVKRSNACDEYIAHSDKKRRGDIEISENYMIALQTRCTR